jgi:hypothetical protein
LISKSNFFALSEYPYLAVVYILKIMVMKTRLLVVLIILLATISYSQVGINTITPEAQLDIVAGTTPSEKDGILIPRLDEYPTGVGANQDGMMIFVTGNGTPTKGFYYWDNDATSWIPISGATGGDVDWNVNGTSTSPTTINDNIYTQGNVKIGLNNTTETSRFYVNSDLASTNSGIRNIMIGNDDTVISYGIYNQGDITDASLHTGFHNVLSGTTDNTLYGIENRIAATGNGLKIAVRNEFDFSAPQGAKQGMLNRFEGGNSFVTGVRNEAPGAWSVTGILTGVENDLSAGGNGVRYGVRNSINGLGTGAKYGSYNNIGSTAGGIHYGVYSDVRKTNSYAGFFIGRMSLGTDGVLNRYLMPAADGTAGQVMTTDGSGNVTFQDATGGGTLDEAYDFGGAGAGRIIVADNGAVDIQDTGGLRVEGDVIAAANIVHDGDGDTSVQFTTDRIQINAGGTNYIDIDHANQEVAFNENSSEIDFRIEGGTNQNMFFVDGSTNRIGIGTNTPGNPFHISMNTPFDLIHQNTGQDDIFLTGGGNNGINEVAASIAFGGTNNRSNLRRAAISSLQTGGDVDFTGLAFYVHGNAINQSPMAEGMRLSHQGFLGINNTNPSATLDVVGTMQFVDGNETNGYVLASDANGNATWTDPASLISNDNDWTISGTDQYAANSGNVGIGDPTPDYKLDLEYAGVLDRAFNIDYQNTAGTGIAQGLNVTTQSNSTGFVWGANVELINTNSSSESIGIRSTNTSGANSKIGIMASAVGTGSQNIGISGRATLATTNYGGYFTADAGGTTNYGILAIAEGASGTNWAGYFGDSSPGSGNVFVNDNLRVDGQLAIDPTGTGYSFPTVDGANGQVLTTDGAGNVSFQAVPGDGTGTDDQNLLTPSLVGTTLNLGIENGSGASVNLSSLQDGTGTDDQNLLTPSLVGTTLNLGIENGSGASVNLSSLQDGTGTDDQTINTFSFNSTTNTLTLQIEDDAGGAQTVNLSSLNGASESTTASNGLTEVADDILLGGTLTQNTTINQGNFDMHYQLGSGSTADFQVIRGGGSNLITAGNDGYIVLGATATLTNPRLQVRGGATFGSYMADFYNNAANPNAAAVSIRVATSVAHSGNYIGFFKNGNTLTGHISGNGSGGVNYSTVSDRRLKTNILDVDNSLELINKIQPRIYEYKSNVGKKEYGFIAQELQEAYPQAVIGDPNGDVTSKPMMVDYGRLTPILTAGVKELHERIKKLEKENEELKKTVASYENIEARLSALENKGGLKLEKSNTISERK